MQIFALKEFKFVAHAPHLYLIWDCDLSSNEKDHSVTPIHLIQSDFTFRRSLADYDGNRLFRSHSRKLPGEINFELSSHHSSRGNLLNKSYRSLQSSSDPSPDKIEDLKLVVVFDNCKFLNNKLPDTPGKFDTIPGIITVDPYYHDIIINNSLFANNSFNDPGISVSLLHNLNLTLIV